MPELQRLTRKDLMYFGAFIVLILACFSYLLFTDSTFYTRDISQYYRPVKILAMESVQQGIFPFWNPYISCGQPFFATVQHGLLYPFSLAMYFFPFEWGFKYLIVVQILLTGLGIYLLLRSLGLNQWSGLAAVVIYVLSGTAMSLINLLTSLQALTWLGFAWLFFTQALRSRTWWGWALILAIVLALQFYAGQPEIMYLTFLFLLVYGLSQQWSKWHLILKILLLAGVISVSLILVEVVPFLELVRWSSRPVNNQSQQLFWSLPPQQLFSLAWPLALSGQQEWLKSMYFGLLPLGLCVAALFRKKDKQVVLRGWIIIISMSMLIAFGTYTPAYRLFSIIIPGLAMIRYPVKLFIFTNYFLAVLAAYGWQRLEPVFKSRRLKVFLLAVIGVSSWYVTGRLEQYVPISLTREQGIKGTILKSSGEYRYGLTPWTYTQVTEGFSATNSTVNIASLENSTRWAMLPNMAMVNHAFIMRGYESINLGTFEDFYAYLSFQRSPSASLILDLMGVRYLVSLKPLMDPGLTLVQDQGWKIYRKETILPRAFLTKELVKGYNGLAPVLEKMTRSISFMPSALIQSYEMNQVRIQVKAPQPGTLVLGDVYYPGWKATIAGKEAAVYPAYYLFRGVSLLAGEQEIVFNYRPSYFPLVLTVTLICFLVLGTVWLFYGVNYALK